MLLLDNLVRSLALTCLDAGDERTTVYPARAAACLPPAETSTDTDICSSICQARSPSQLAAYQTVTDVRREENRRMVWGAQCLATVTVARETEFYNNYTPFFLTEPFNVSTERITNLVLL